jgi:hypothetical protein
MPLRRLRRIRQTLATAVIAVLCAAGALVPGRAPFAPAADRGAADARGPAVRAEAALVPGAPATAYLAAAAAPAAPRRITGPHAAEVTGAIAALSADVRALSHPRALEDAFRSYYAYRAAHRGRGDKPYLYFVDYGLPASAPRGYVFDMAARRVVEGPFPVAHGRGSAADRAGVPRRFANLFGSAATSLGLFVAQELYPFRGHSAGRPYASTGLRLKGVSGAFNSLARARGVVAHGAPYVTAGGAGRSEGCPAMEPARAARLLPKLAGGGLVFLFAPDARWMARDPWLAAGRAARADSDEG